MDNLDNVTLKDVREIDRTKKYMLFFDEKLTESACEKISDMLKDFLSGNKTFLVVSGGVKLVEITKEEHENN